MKSKLCLFIVLTLLMGVVSSPLAQGPKGGGKPKGGKRIVVKDPVALEKAILNAVGLNASQKRDTDHLISNLQTEIKKVNGLGLAPRDPAIQRRRMIGIKAEYDRGIKKILTPTQLKKYIKIHLQIEQKLKQNQRRRGGVHF